MINKINKKEDLYTVKSRNELKSLAYAQIKRVFVKALKCIEIKFGKNFDGYLDMRAEILRAGNDAYRLISETIDSDFNIEKIPNILTIRFGKDEDEGEGNGNK